MIYPSGRGSAGISRNSVGYKLHQKKTGDGATVSGAVSYIRGMRKGGGLQGWRVQEGHMVVPRGARDIAQGNPGGNLAGIKE